MKIPEDIHNSPELETPSPEELDPPSKTWQQLSFMLPISAKTLYVVSQGSYARGLFEIVPDHSLPRTTVQVNVDCCYMSPDIFERTSICMTERGPGEQGVCIFTPTSALHSEPLDSTVYRVAVRLPTSGSCPLRISTLEVNLPLFRLVIPELGHIIRFGSLLLCTSKREINISSVHCEDAIFDTSDGPVGGSVRTTSSLAVSTSRASISLDVTMENDVDQQATKLILSNSEGAIRSTISLISPGSSEQTPTRYSVEASTSNEELHIAFPRQESFSYCKLTASTSNGDALVRLHPAYEGIFDISTSDDNVCVEYDDSVQDPMKLGRKRHFKLDYAGYSQAASGQVHWGGNRLLGSVAVSTSKARNRLILQ